MKRTIYLFVAFIGIVLLFGFCYYRSFQNALLHYNYEAVEQNTEILQQLLEKSGKSEQLLYEIIESKTTLEEADIEAVSGDNVLNQKAEYILETVYLSANETVREQFALPGFMVGISRGELDAYLEGYMECMPVNEYLEGLIAYELVSFSEQKVVLRKIYDEAKIENRFFICEKGGFVTVYYSDRKTVYEYTQIECALLSANDRLQVREGFYVRDTKELYSILEGYTS